MEREKSWVSLNVEALCAHHDGAHLVKVGKIETGGLCVWGGRRG